MSDLDRLDTGELAIGIRGISYERLVDATGMWVLGEAERPPSSPRPPSGPESGTPDRMPQQGWQIDGKGDE